VSGLPAYDPADVPPPDPRAASETEARSAVRAPLAFNGVVGESTTKSNTVVETGSCEVSYNGLDHMTASGEVFDATALTAAHESLPFGTLVRVTNPASGESVVVRVNDRGPYYGDRCLDLTAGAFASIADPSAGVVDVRYEVLAQDAT
jgi:rare lipoprotein A